MQVERLEPKQLLSSSVIGGLAQPPVLSMFRYSATLVGVEKAVGSVCKTEDFSQLDASLATLSARLPYGQQLLSQWNNDQRGFDANIPGSGLAMQQRMLSDTVAYAQRGATEEQFRVIGRGSGVFYPDVQPFTKNEIFRDSSESSVLYNFAVATVTNLTGQKNLSVRVDASVNGKFYPPYKLSIGTEYRYLLYLAYPTSSSPLVNYTVVINGQSLSPIPAWTKTKQRYDSFVRNLVPAQGSQWELSVNAGKFTLTQIWSST